MGIAGLPTPTPAERARICELKGRTWLGCHAECRGAHGAGRGRAGSPLACASSLLEAGQAQGSSLLPMGEIKAWKGQACLCGGSGAPATPCTHPHRDP